ncbi:MAG TPA: FAD-dependent oxidoreductase [Clostridia bacterium]|nr:FAD-dependent oxidoreductase [Clostridia bacterium]
MIIGNSAAGVFAAEAIAKNDPTGEIVMISKEKHMPYSRCLTTYLIAGDIGRDKMFLRPGGHFDQMPAQIINDSEVTAIKPEKKTVVLNNNEELSYDRLLVASGASPARPDVPGAEADGVFTLRTLDDADRIMKLALPGKQAVILGGGLVSLKTAYALIKRGLKVRVLVTSPQILSQMLDATAAGLLQKRLEEHGVEFGLNRAVDELVTGDGGQVEAAVLDGGEKMSCNLVVVGKGVRPNVGFLDETGIEINWGVLVNDYLQTSVENIYAAGDVAETTDLLLGSKRVNATWPNATEQGRVAGINMAGGNRKYIGSLAMNSVEFFGLPAISVGLTRVDEADYEVHETYKPERDFYKKLVFRDNHLVGFTVVGNISAVGILTGLIKYKIDVTEEKYRLTS